MRLVRPFIFNLCLPVVTLFVLSPSFSGSARAQAQVSLPSAAYASHTPVFEKGHDYLQGVGETVKLANGSVSVRLSVPVTKGCGLTPSYGVNYDSADFDDCLT